MKYEDMKNKEFIFACLNTLKSKDVISDSVLSILTNSDECGKRFCCSSGFSILIEVPCGCDDEYLKKICYFGKQRRYYQERFIVNENLLL